MFSPANPQPFKLIFNTFEHDLQVLRFKGTEEINPPYRVEIDLVSETDDLDLKNLLYKPPVEVEVAGCALPPAGAGARYGSVVIPRSGMEVVVSFFEGAPSFALTAELEQALKRQRLECQDFRDAYPFPQSRQVQP